MKKAELDRRLSATKIAKHIESEFSIQLTSQSVSNRKKKRKDLKDRVALKNSWLFAKHKKKHLSGPRTTFHAPLLTGIRWFGRDERNAIWGWWYHNKMAANRWKLQLGSRYTFQQDGSSKHTSKLVSGKAYQDYEVTSTVPTLIRLSYSGQFFR